MQLRPQGFELFLGGFRHLAHAIFPLGAAVVAAAGVVSTALGLSVCRMALAVLKQSAARVSVTLAVAIVGRLPPPTRYRLSWSHERCVAFTTELAGLLPIMW